jgi:hypothetical protein
MDRTARSHCSLENAVDLTLSGMKVASAASSVHRLAMVAKDDPVV